MLMQAIITKFHGPSNVRGSRLSVRTSGSKRTEFWWSYRHEHDSTENHRMAAEEMQRRKDWPGKYVGGSIEPGSIAWVYAGLAAEISALSSPVAYGVKL